MDVRHEQAQAVRRLQAGELLLQDLPAGALEQGAQEALQVPGRYQGQEQGGPSAEPLPKMQKKSR